MHFQARILLSFFLILSTLINPSFHLFHVCTEFSKSEVSCSSHDHQGGCQNEEELNTEQDCQICELLATFTLAYSFFDSINYFVNLITNQRTYNEISYSLFLSIFSARAPPYL